MVCMSFLIFASYSLYEGYSYIHLVIKIICLYKDSSCDNVDTVALVGVILKDVIWGWIYIEYVDDENRIIYDS